MFIRVNLISEIRDRKVTQWVAAYGGGAWLALQAINLLAPQFGWSTYQQRILTCLLAVGVAPAVVLAWIHGKKGFQGFTGREIIGLGALLLVLGFGVMHLGSTFSQQEEDAFLNSARIRILSVTPPAGTLLKESDLNGGIPITVSIEQSFSGSRPGGDTPTQRKPVIYLHEMYEGHTDERSFQVRVLDEQESTWTTRQMSLKGKLTNYSVRNGKLKLLLIMMYAHDQGEATGPLGEPVVIEYPVEPLK